MQASPSTPRRRKAGWRAPRGWLAGIAVALVGLGPGPATAEELSWRASSVQGPRAPGVNTRLGVAIFSTGEPATLRRRVEPDGLPVDGRLAIRVETVFRFEDGSTLTLNSRETIHLGPGNVHGVDEWSGEGTVSGGTGRYAGATGRFSFRARMGMDATVDGALGDSFLVGRATIERPVRQP